MIYLTQIVWNGFPVPLSKFTIYLEAFAPSLYK